jgi:Alkylmercury lyase
MPQFVPEFEWTDDALRLRQFMFDFWFEQRRPPNLHDAHCALGLDRRRLEAAYQLLDLGRNCTVDQRTQNFNLLKAPPFASFPTLYPMYAGDEFLAYAGCAHEVLGFSNSPAVVEAVVRCESCCECCFTPITVEVRGLEVLSCEPTEPLIHVTETPWEWLKVDMVSMCDTTNFALDAAHAERYEHMQGRRGVLFTLAQATEYIRFVAEARLWDYHWPPMTGATVRGDALLDRLDAVGLDTTPFRTPPVPPSA